MIGTGKRVGKTAVSGHLARLVDARYRGEGGVVVVAMGRGGPPQPEPVAGRDELNAADLLRTSRAGGHAASDCYEDAVLARVPTIGCRRCGGGLAGEAFDTNVAEALPLVEASGAALAIFEGSGAVMPPVAAQATLCVAGAAQPPGYVTGYLGAYRLLLSDLLVLTMCEPPFAGPDAVAALVEDALALKPGLEVVPTVFRPRPAQPVRGRRVAYFSTAPCRGAAGADRRARGATTAPRSCWLRPHLADRGALGADVRRAAAEADVFLTEIKAAAIDVVADAAEASGKELVFCDNEPRPLDAAALRAGRAEPAAASLLDDRLLALAELARDRFAAPVTGRTGTHGEGADERRRARGGGRRWRGRFTLLEGADGADPDGDGARAETRLQHRRRRRARPAEDRRTGASPLANLRDIAREVLGADDGDTLIARYLQWQSLRRMEVPLIVLIGGATGVGKSTSPRSSPTVWASTVWPRPT